MSELARRYGPRWALAHVSFELPPGSACRVTGANGSGKSTLLKCLATALVPHNGTVTLAGRDTWRHRSRVRPEIAFLSHASRLYEDLSGPDNLRIWAGLGGYDVDVPAALARVGLPSDRRDPVRSYSAGMKRRLALALVLLKEPRLALLDEPFSALDPIGRTVVAGVVRELREAGTIVVMATHLPDEAASLCDHSLHLDNGRVVRWEAA